MVGKRFVTVAWPDSTLGDSMRYFGIDHRAGHHRRHPPKPLQCEDVYPCPVCRHGQLSMLVLMDVLACNFCRHIFTVDFGQQSIRLEDSTQHLQWQWSGRNWRPLRQSQGELTLWAWCVGFALVAFPSALVWLSYSTFPPAPNSTAGWFPLIWIALTFVLHLSVVLWIFLEYYQVPAYVALKIQLQRWRRQL